MINKVALIKMGGWLAMLWGKKGESMDRRPPTSKKFEMVDHSQDGFVKLVSEQAFPLELR